MNVTVLVPVQLIIKGDNKLKEVQEQLKLANDILGQCELESAPQIIEDIEE